VTYNVSCFSISVDITYGLIPFLDICNLQQCGQGTWMSILCIMVSVS